MIRVYEIPEHVHVLLVEHGSDLDSCYDADAEVASRARGVGNRSRGIVVRDGDSPEPRLPCATHQRGRIAAPVRCGRVEMEIDHGPGGSAPRCRTAGGAHTR